MSIWPNPAGKLNAPSTTRRSGSEPSTLNQPFLSTSGARAISRISRRKFSARRISTSTSPTARSIYGLVEIGQEIHAEHFKAVAAAIIFADEMRRKVKEKNL